MYTATYSPDDNKLRLYASTRLDPDTYNRVRSAGFIWAPKQQLFVAPMWTPDRADLLLELAGDIDDEDRSLVDRAEERADRFTDYHHSRLEDAESAHKAVSAIADGIPLGQPILVGHHSERHARKDAERIENGMRRAIKMWDTAQYWKSRAAGAIRHAKYKERPDVRARRIKGIEADKRKRIAQKAAAAEIVRKFALVDQPEKWKTREDGTIPNRQERAYFIAGRLSGGPYCAIVQIGGVNPYEGHYSAYDVLAPDDKRYKHCPAMTVDEVIAKFAAWQAETDAYCDRWIAHYDFRLEYERAMLAEAGGLVTDRTPYPIVPGGRVLIGSEWATVRRVNRKDGRIVSVTTNLRYVRVRGIEEVSDYQPPTAASAAAVKAASKLPPMINRETPGSRHMTQAEYTAMCSDYKGTKIAPASAEHGAYRYRTAFSGGGVCRVVPVFLTDAKTHELPPPPEDDTPKPPPLPAPESDLTTAEQIERLQASNDAREARQAEAAPFDALRESLKTGVQVVSAPQLFPTPPEVARRMQELADIHPGMRVLEPSAGTGNLVESLRTQGQNIVAVEVNYSLADRLRQRFAHIDVRQADFLSCNGDLGTFDRVVMNPPFENGADIKHIRHAYTFLRPGGRLVAICAGGPRQMEAFGDDVREELPSGTFAGTGVRAAIVVLDKPEA